LSQYVSCCKEQREKYLNPTPHPPLENSGDYQTVGKGEDARPDRADVKLPQEFLETVVFLFLILQRVLLAAKVLLLVSVFLIRSRGL